MCMRDKNLTIKILGGKDRTWKSCFFLLNFFLLHILHQTADNGSPENTSKRYFHWRFILEVNSQSRKQVPITFTASSGEDTGLVTYNLAQKIIFGNFMLPKSFFALA